MTERRRNPRYLCSHLVRVLSQDGQGETALLEDISAEGAAVAVESAVEAGSAVELIAPGWQAAARVRYCLARENDFRLGLEFTDGRRWEEHHWRPDHIFLPPPRG